jgi:hypothetical protein
MSVPSVVIGPYVVGGKPPPLVYQFLDSSGVAIDLTGYTAVFNFRSVDSGVATAGAATITAPLTGHVTHTWTGAEFPTSGDHWAEFWVGNTVQLFCSLLLKYNVRAAVGPVPAI